MGHDVTPPARNAAKEDYQPIIGPTYQRRREEERSEHRIALGPSTDPNLVAEPRPCNPESARTATAPTSSLRRRAVAPTCSSTPAPATSLTTANGVGGYFNDDWSWGFAPRGDAIDRNRCDVIASSIQPGPDADQRLCWHTANHAFGVGWRCGAQDQLNGAYLWHRVIFQAR